MYHNVLNPLVPIVANIVLNTNDLAKKILCDITPKFISYLFVYFILFRFLHWDKTFP